jgi:hypothetical protein
LYIFFPNSNENPVSFVYEIDSNPRKHFRLNDVPNPENAVWKFAVASFPVVEVFPIGNFRDM